METTDVQIAVDDSEETIGLPADVLSFFGGGEQPAAETVGDLLIVDCAHRLHGHVHHGEEAADPRIEEAERSMRELFEERFGASFAEVTGHAH